SAATRLEFREHTRQVSPEALGSRLTSSRVRSARKRTAGYSRSTALMQACQSALRGILLHLFEGFLQSFPPERCRRPTRHACRIFKIESGIGCGNGYTGEGELPTARPARSRPHPREPARMFPSPVKRGRAFDMKQL